MAPIVADAEAGFGGALNAFELMKAMIEAGAAGVHFEDQLASEKKCGHLGGKVLVPIAQHIRTLNAARLAADVEGVATVLLCRTDAHSAQLLTSDVDERDHPFISGERTAGRVSSASSPAWASSMRSRAAWHSRLMPICCGGRPASRTWRRRSNSPMPSTGEFPGKMLAYNCSPSFNWQQEAAAGANCQLPARYRRAWATSSSSSRWPASTA